MGITEAGLGMDAIELIDAKFNCEKIKEYADLVRLHVERARTFLATIGAVQHGALVDVSNGANISLPDELTIRLEEWMKCHPDHSPFTRTAMNHYLIALLRDDKNANVYEPLIELFRLGGDFYIENTIFFMENTVPIPGRLD